LSDTRGADFFLSEFPAAVCLRRQMRLICVLHPSPQNRKPKPRAQSHCLVFHRFCGFIVLCLILYSNHKRRCQSGDDGDAKSCCQSSKRKQFLTQSVGAPEAKNRSTRHSPRSFRLESGPGEPGRKFKNGIAAAPPFADGSAALEIAQTCSYANSIQPTISIFGKNHINSYGTISNMTS